MAAVNPNDLSISTGYLYVAPINTTATIESLAEDGSNIADVITDFEAAYPTNAWKRLASIKDLSIEETPAGDKKEVITDDTGLIFTSAKAGATVKATWYESKNVDVGEILTGISSVTQVDGANTNNLIGYKITNRVLPRFAVKIQGTRGTKIEQYYISDATIGGSLITQFLKSDGEPQGSSVEITANEGGMILKKIPQ